VLEAAASGLEAYQDFKRARGIIDFADQEALALKLLRRPAVREHLEDQIDLVLIDEFQDTSPIQLAIFLELSRLSRRTVWVGDQKQSIFGFRGTDPAIMDSAMETVLGGDAPATLKKSYRSRRDLVQLTSRVFARAFGALGMAPELVKLKPALSAQDEPDDLGPILEQWTMDSTKVDVDNACVAAGIKKLLGDRSVRVRDDEPGTSRRVRAGDVAVLCRTNAACKAVAVQLGELGIPAVLSRPGLMSTPEGLVSLAALRLWVDPRDSLALANLSRFLDHPDDGEAWLQKLLEHKYARAFEDLEEVKRLGEARREHPVAGALAVLDLAMQAVDIRELCLRWGDAPRRLANLDRLRAHAVSFIGHAEASGSAVTPAGLVRHLEQLSGDDEDAQAAVATGDAVTVLTWHRAKGLEWPVTVLFQLQKTFKGSALGVQVVSDRDQIDLDDPLADRWVRYWPYPFGARSAGIPFNNRLAGHVDQVEALERQRRQELRLLYVGWTRARDRLVLATRPGKLTTGILGLLKDKHDHLLLKEPGKTSTWAGHTIEVVRRSLSPADPARKELRPGEAPVRAGLEEHPPAYLYPSEMECDAQLETVETIGKRMAIEGKPNMTDLGEAIHGFFAADLPGLDSGKRKELAAGMLTRWGVDGAVEPAALVAASDNLRQWGERNHPGARWHREWPIRYRTSEGSVISGFIDLVLDTRNGLVVIDHKSFPGKLEGDQVRIRKYAGQLRTYADAVPAAQGKPVRDTLVHLPISGEMVCVSS